MFYTVDCPKCGAKQEGLDLEETGGSFVCSCCGEQIQVELQLEEEKAVNDK